MINGVILAKCPKCNAVVELNDKGKGVCEFCKKRIKVEITK